MESKNKFRVGKKEGRVILFVETGKEYLVFPVGSESHVQEFCDYLNLKESTGLTEQSMIFHESNKTLSKALSDACDEIKSLKEQVRSLKQGRSKLDIPKLQKQFDDILDEIKGQGIENVILSSIEKEWDNKSDDIFNADRKETKNIVLKKTSTGEYIAMPSDKYSVSGWYWTKDYQSMYLFSETKANKFIVENQFSNVEKEYILPQEQEAVCDDSCHLKYLRKNDGRVPCCKTWRKEEV